MLVESIKQVAKEIKNAYGNEFGMPFRQEDKLIAKNLSKENFKEFLPEFTGKKIAFIDGGNLKILGGANFSILYNRVYYCIFENNKRIKSEKNKAEFLSLTYSKKEDEQALDKFNETTVKNGNETTKSKSSNEIFYTTKLFPINEFTREILPNENDLKIFLKDETVALKGRFASLNSVEGIARIFAEWKMTKKAIENLNEGDLVIRDGSLQSGVKNETNYAYDVYSKTINKKVILLGLSKTCTLLTENGYSLISAVNYFADKNNLKKEWYCENVFEIKENFPIDLNFVKLNKNSNYIFRIENLTEQKEKKENAIKNLANESKGVAFPGYPYGLIDADKNSRVRKKEIENIKPLVLSEISKTEIWKEIGISVRAVDSHDFLNLIIGE